MKRFVTHAADVKLAKRLWGKELGRLAITTLKQTIETHSLSLVAGDLIYFGGGWYVTHTGLLWVGRRNRFAGIYVRPPATLFCSTSFRLAVYGTPFHSPSCRGFF